MRVPEVRTRISGDEIVAECVPRQDRTLTHVRRAIHVRVAAHVLTVPVQRRAVRVQHVNGVHDYSVALAYLF